MFNKHSTGGSDFLGGNFTVSLETESGATSCTFITINDDSIFEDVEEFRVVLEMDPDTPFIQVGDTSVAVIRIDDVGKQNAEIVIIMEHIGTR